ncbi:MAG: hypothetical protein C4291_05630 [Candidatus Dadabacteria bacterium]
MSKRIFFYEFTLFIPIFLFCNLAFAQTGKFEKSTLEAVGRGEVKIKPDVVYLTISVEATAKKASDAVRENAEKMKSVMDKLKSEIGKEDRITTSGYTLSPIYEYNDKIKGSQLTGYRASNGVMIETRNLNDIGKLIDSATQVGANRVDSLSFDTDRREEYKRQALVQAVQDARATADTVARALGVKVVKILRISPSYEVPRPMVRELGFAKMAASQAAPTPIEPGELTVSATVNIVFEIE